MARAWDERTPKEHRRVQNVALRQTVLQMALGHVPLVRARLGAMGLDARVFKGLEELQRLPMTLRRDVLDRVRNPEGPGAVVLLGTAEGVKRFSDRSVLRRVALARLFGGEEVQEMAIEAATRSIHLHLIPGPGGRIPVAYTRDDLDLLARAGARLAALLGLERADRLINLVPFGPSLEFWGIFYMAHGVGMSALHARRDRDLGRGLALWADADPTVVAVPADEAVGFPAAAREAGVDLSAVAVVIAVGRSLTTEERGTLGESLVASGATEARIACAYGVAEGRVLWGECAVPAGRTETFGFHTFPDLEVLEVVSPETGAPVADQEPGEIVVTPLGFRGGGMLRWRSGDLALGGVTHAPCPNCGRTVPRVGPTVRRGAWQRVVSLDGKRAWIDLRDAGAAATERARDWQVELLASDGAHQLLVHLSAPEDPAPLIDLYEDLNRLSAHPTQLVLQSPEALAERHRAAPAPWHRYWDRSVV